MGSNEIIVLPIRLIALRAATKHGQYGHRKLGWKVCKRILLFIYFYLYIVQQNQSVYNFLNRD